MGKAWNQGLLEHGKKICSSFKSNEVIKIKSNRKSRNKSEKFSKKESSEIQDVTSGTTPSGCAWSPDRRKARKKKQSIKDQNRLQAIGPNLGDYTEWVRLRAPTGRKVSQ